MIKRLEKDYAFMNIFDFGEDRHTPSAGKLLLKNNCSYNSIEDQRMARSRENVVRATTSFLLPSKNELILVLLISDAEEID
jgi:hypothetical protein